MKKILMVTAMLTFALAASAQFYLGGSVGVSTNTVYNAPFFASS